MSAIRRSTLVLALAGVCGVSLLACAMPHVNSADPLDSEATTSAVPAVIPRPAPVTVTVDGSAAQKSLRTVVQLTAERVMTADTVAAAKWGTSQPIDELTDEKAVVDAAVAQAAEVGLNQASAQRVSNDQFAVNNAVHGALFARWTAHPAQRPAQRPDLAADVRPALDRVDGQLLSALREAQLLLSGTACATEVSQEAAAIATEKGLDAIHRNGIHQALGHAYFSG
ncbi:gamma subclass chorismate mutase AroQ [Streptomyces vinaceus]|uniref:gamma subclass chorismate mutase AroQ n=1 Tax=Streptomyces vinaceus TaxID=1960 RepID=UPI0035DB6707